MLDILGKPCNNLQIKKALIPLKGKSIKINYNLGRNKYETYIGKIIKIYNSIFLIETKGIIKSFSFADLITKTIKITF